ncbi:cytochrome P450 [Nocardia sp. NPDC088792]|uniref:cytochrome P450 n=1 Tax=Nocardia sp. NPDC088792 TaxID=3364332 RepID=UPI0037F87D6B
MNSETVPVSRKCPHLPPPEHLALQRECPISRATLPTGAQTWVLTRYDDIRQMLNDPRFSSDLLDPNFPSLFPRPTRTKPSFVAMDGEEHKSERKLLTGEFAIGRMNLLRPKIEEIVNSCLDRMFAEGGPVDLITELALPVPTAVICGLLGVPYEDHAFFQLNAAHMIDGRLSHEERRDAVIRLRSYIDQLVALKESVPTDDILSRQIIRRRELDSYDHQEMVSTSMVLLVAGHETIANQIGLNVMTLLRQPEALANLRANPANIPNAIEELLRHFTILEFSSSRVAKEDAEIAGVRIKAGDGVFTLTHTANHDPAVYAQPSELDFDRPRNLHLAFGYGPHVCLGQHLARVQLQVVLTVLLRRVPSLRLADPEAELIYKTGGPVFGLQTLPVTW